MNTCFTVDQIIDAKDLQALQDNFAQLADIQLVLLDAGGKTVTKQSNCPPELGDTPFWNVARFEALRKRYEESQSPAWEHNDAGDYAIVVPLTVDNESIGWWAVKRACLDVARQDTPESVVTYIVNSLSEFNDIVSQMALRIKRLQRNAYNLDNQNKRLQALVDASEVAMYVSDYYTGEMLMVNRAMCQAEGRSADMMLGKKCWSIDHAHEKGFCSFCPRESLVDAHGKPSGVHVWEHFNPRVCRWFRCVHKAIYWEGDRLAQLVTLTDITKEKQLWENLAFAAYYDRHTGLANTEKLHVDLDEKQNDPDVDNVHLICIQLKSMHQFSRIHGKKNCRSLFTQIGEWLKSLGDNLEVYRTDGYGFILMLCNQRLKDCKELSKTIRLRFNEAWQLDINGNPVYHFCSIAGSIICLNSSFFHQDILEIAERTLESASESREFFIYDESIDEQERQRVEFEISLKNQVRNNMQGFSVCYQPLVDVISGVWYGVEALCRWTNVYTGDVVSPNVFIPEAEQLGLIGEIGEWVLDQSVALCKELGLDTIQTFHLSVNMSFSQIMDDNFVKRVASILENHAYPPEKLTLEVTESVQFHFNEHTLSTIRRLRKLGVHLALDDFGTGYSSFHLLKNVPAKYVKTERAFIKDVEEDEQTQYLYSLIADLAHLNGMKLIVEGVETQRQLELVRKNGADLIQGYLFSRPLAKEALADNVSKFQKADPARTGARITADEMHQWLSNKTVQSVPPQLFRLLNQFVELLFQRMDIEPLFREMLKVVGTHFDVACCFAHIYGKLEDNSKSFLWNAEHTKGSTLIGKLMTESAKPALDDVFNKYGALISSEAVSIAPDISKLLGVASPAAMLMLPMRNKEEITGFVGLLDYKSRNWEQNEMVLLWNMARILGDTWEQYLFNRSSMRRSQILTDVLSATGMNIMVCDIETAKILWANEPGEAGVVNRGMIGKRCYEVLQGKSERCSYCKVPKLLAGDGHSLIQHKHHNNVFGRTLMVLDGLIQWENNKLAHIEYCWNAPQSTGTTQNKQAKEQDMVLWN